MMRVYGKGERRKDDAASKCRRLTKRSQNVTRKMRKMDFFLEKSPLFAVSSGMRQGVLLWKMIARHHYVVHLTCGILRIFKHFSGFGLLLLPNIVHARPHATNANR